MSHPPKIDRKALKTPDDFVQRGTAILGIVARYRTRFVPILILMTVALLGGYAYDWWNTGKVESAWKAYNEASKAPEPAKWDQLKTVFTSYPRSRPVILAGASLADHYFDEAKKQVMKDPVANPADAAAAIEWYGKLLSGTDLVPGEKQLLLINRANSYELEKKYDEALKDLAQAADLGGDIKGMALLNTGRVLELKDDKAKAIETYEKIAGDFLNTEYAKVAKNNVRRLKSPLLSNQKF